MSMQEILAAVANKEITAEEAGALIANIGKKPQGVYFEISDKGGIKIKGLARRWPVVMYPNEITALLGASDKLIAFIEANKDKLSFHKGELAEKTAEPEQREAA